MYVIKRQKVENTEELSDIHDIQDTVRKSNIYYIWIPKEERENWAEAIFEAIVDKNFQDQESWIRKFKKPYKYQLRQRKHLNTL